MALYVGDSDNIVLMLGANEVSAAYIGDLQIYPLSPFAVSPSSLHLNNIDLTAQLRIKSPEAWTITETSGGWLTLSANSGTAGVTMVTVTATANTATRNATITVTTANYTKTVSVEQIYVDFENSRLLHIHNTSNSTGTITANVGGNLEYSYDTINWATYATGETSSVTVPSGGYIFLRGDNQVCPFYHFNMDVEHTVAGNALSVISSTNYDSMTALDTSGGRWAHFNLMFDNDTYLTDVSKLDWGLITNAPRCFQYTFRGCTSLTAGAHFEQFTSIYMDAFYYTYQNCGNLTVAYAPTVSNWNNSGVYYWLTNVAASGIVVMDPNTANVQTNNTSGIPTGWTRVDSYYSVTLDGTDQPFDYATSDGRSGTVSGSTTTLRLDYPQTLSITTAGPKYHLYINGNDTHNGPSYTLDYLDLANGDTLTCTFQGEPS